MPAPQVLMLLGATGLVGHLALQQALTDIRVARVVAPTRRALPPQPKLDNPVVDFDHLPEQAPWWAVDAVVCALGTTMAQAGSQAAFRRVDHELPLHCARQALRYGARAFALNSALGADVSSWVFYSRVKGELERDLRTLGYPSLTLVRPGLIDGERREKRPGEGRALAVSKALGALLPRRYRPVPAANIAHHLREAALAGRPGVQVLMSEQLLGSD